MGFPTLNLKLSLCDMEKIFSLYQQEGVFIVQVFINGENFLGLLHLGSRPTFDSEEFRVEIFLFNFDAEIEKHSEIFFNIREKIRDVQKFSSPEKLIEQIQKDVEYAKDRTKKNS